MSLALLALLLFGIERCRRGAPPSSSEPAGPGVEPATPAPSAPGGERASAAPPPAATSDPRESIRVLGFRMDGTGVSLTTAALAPGRVKAPPVSSAADRLEFEVHDSQDAVVYAGSFDHPLRARREVEDEARPGQLRSVAVTVPANQFLLRLPADVPAVRVVFFDVTPTDRRLVGEISLR